MEWEAASSAGRTRLNLTPSLLLPRCVTLGKSLKFTELLGAHDSNEGEHFPSPRTYTDKLQTLWRRVDVEQGFNARWCFSLSVSHGYFRARGCPITQIGTLAPASEAFGSGLMPALLAPTWIPSLHRECFPQTFGLLRLDCNSLCESRSRQLHVQRDVELRSSCLLYQEPLKSKPQQAAWLERMTLKGSLQPRGLRFSSVLSSHSLGGKVVYTELHQLLPQPGTLTLPSPGSPLPAHLPRLHTSVTLLLKSSWSPQLSFLMGLEHHPPILFYILSGISTLKMTVKTLDPGLLYPRQDLAQSRCWRDSG